MPYLAIIIINYNSLKHTLECLKSLSKLKWKGKLTIYIIDNASRVDPRPVIKQKFSQVIIIKNKHNLGFAQGNNIGVKAALNKGADMIMLLNNDTKVHPQLVNNLYQALIKFKAAIVVPKIYFYPNYEFHQDRYKKSQLGKVIWYAGGHIDWQNVQGIHDGVDEVDKSPRGWSNGLPKSGVQRLINTPRTVEFATGCCMMIKSEVIGKIGLFNSKYFLYFEDADFSIRAKRAGYVIHYEPCAIVWHKNAESSGGSGSRLQDYYFTRNRLFFGSRYASLRTKFALYCESIKLLFTGPKWKQRGVIDFYLRRFGKTRFRTLHPQGSEPC